ncbi:PilZ domain-containing protein [Psychrosphaera aestuarii]|uniref:PilZ domain-containing protein n=1 Tax=Psychrosphaera aestuarii TaxID=1266052 RepID=UPI001B320DE9|nr:PilZ domain-containing protein [Psychrosphaera aestuarii]
MINETDLEQFTEYFQMSHSIDININVGDVLANTPNDADFEADIPLPYKLASDLKGVEQTMLRPLRQLGDVIEPLADYLKAQSRKIDLMMHYILQAEDESDQRHSTLSFGGGGFVFCSKERYAETHFLICKLFFNDEATAIYCLGRIIATKSNADGSYEYTVLFHRIRDEDREIVVRASLHQQSKQLLKKTQQRQNEKS